VSATPSSATSTPASGPIAGLFGRTSLDTEAFDELFRLLAYLFCRVRLDRLDARQLLTRHDDEVARRRSRRRCSDAIAGCYATAAGDATGHPAATMCVSFA
jgi:hypothetical protein